MIFGFAYAEILLFIPTAIGIASVIATATPNKSDDKIVDALLKIINVVGQNYGKAENRDE